MDNNGHNINLEQDLTKSPLLANTTMNHKQNGEILTLNAIDMSRQNVTKSELVYRLLNRLKYDRFMIPSLLRLLCLESLSRP